MKWYVERMSEREDKHVEQKKRATKQFGWKLPLAGSERVYANLSGIGRTEDLRCYPEFVYSHISCMYNTCIYV